MAAASAVAISVLAIVSVGAPAAVSPPPHIGKLVGERCVLSPHETQLQATAFAAFHLDTGALELAFAGYQEAVGTALTFAGVRELRPNQGNWYWFFDWGGTRVRQLWFPQYPDRPLDCFFPSDLRAAARLVGQEVRAATAPAWQPPELWALSDHRWRTVAWPPSVLITGVDTVVRNMVVHPGSIYLHGQSPSGDPVVLPISAATLREKDRLGDWPDDWGYGE